MGSTATILHADSHLEAHAIVQLELRLGFPTRDAVLEPRKAWRHRAQTGPSMRSASVSEDKRWIMGQQCGMRALSLTSSGALPKENFEYRRRPLQHLRSARDGRELR